jgi:hypothetical protein
LAAAVALGTMAAVAGLGPAALARVQASPPDPDPNGQIAVSVTIPGAPPAPSPAPTASDRPSDSRVQIANARLDWGFNPETRGKSYYGACNFLMAGVPGGDGNAGAAREWGVGDWGAKLYHAESGNAKVVGADSQTAVPFTRRCLDPNGQPVKYDASDQTASTYTATRVRLGKGTGWRDTKTGAAQITWQAAFSVVYYDGLTYFTLTDPVLNVDQAGSATLTATAGGWGSPREGGAWRKHPDTLVVLGEAGTASSTRGEGVETSANGLTLRPAYAGRAVSVPPDAPAQKLGGESKAPGAWPQSFVDFHGLTGLHSYWYSSGAAIDHRKPPDGVFVSWDAARPIPSETNLPETGGGGSGIAPPKLLTTSPTKAAKTQGGAGADVSDPWDLTVEPLVYALGPPDLVPLREAIAGASPAAKAAVLTLLVSAVTALLAWRRGWFRHQPKGIIP